MYQNDRLFLDGGDGGRLKIKSGYEFYSFSWNVLGGLPSG